jgi:hypothetical protein
MLHERERFIRLYVRRLNEINALDIKKAVGCENVNMQKSFLIHVSTRALLGSARRGGERARRGSRK